MTESIYSKAMKIIEERDAEDSSAEPMSPKVAEVVEEVSSIIEEAVRTLALEEHSVDEQIASLLG